MHPLAWPALRSIPRRFSQHYSPGLCRSIAGRRFSHPRRSFHFSAKRSSSQDDKPDTPGRAWNNVIEEPTSTSKDDPIAQVAEEVKGASEERSEKPAWSNAIDEPPTNLKEDSVARRVDENTENQEAALERLARLKDKSSYGSAIRRSGRNVKSAKEPQPFSIPRWFIDRNILLWEEPVWKENIPLVTYSMLEETSTIKAQKTPTTGSDETSTTRDIVSPASDGSTTPAKGTSKDVYQIEKEILREISTMVAAGLQPSSARPTNHTWASKPHLVLHCPKDGGTFFLDAVVGSVAATHGTDLISLDAQDLAEIGGDNLEESSTSNMDSVRAIGYSAHLLMRGQEGTDDPEEEEDEYEEGEEAEDERGHKKPLGYAAAAAARITAVPVATALGSLSDFSKFGKLVGVSIQNGLSRPASSPPQVLKSSVPSPESADDIKASGLMEALLIACQAKRADMQRTTDSTPSVMVPASANGAATGTLGDFEFIMVDPTSSGDKSELRSLIIMINDYAEINATRRGGALLTKLHEVVRKRRSKGQKILIIGTTSSEDLIPSISRSGFRNHQLEANNGPTRTIITPCRASTSDNFFQQDDKQRVKQINIRHVLDMLRQLRPDSQGCMTTASQAALELDSTQVFASGLDDFVWTFERVHRVATVALGLVKDEGFLTSAHIDRALALIESSDNAKYDWILEEKEEAKKYFGPLGARSTALVRSESNKDLEERMRRLRKTCNTHEKLLLNGVVDAESIRTTFADVRAPPETVEALKTLTSLSLVRPEAFTYGVLATDKIPGLLLYGPPGTGKTLLAKAVAKESGATVLEVSGSDVYDMYVGEGEKKVKAIFTLAKKLTPCVVFIDEADAIFGSRGGSTHRTSHRELINQFLREWDGMNDLSAFIMVATNRPFDLDDAVMRRLPRRLLVDLPVEKDREAILKIHLKDEILEPEVSLASLASQTPFYSGSDLKNLSVAAALACVREENDDAAKHNKDKDTAAEAYTYPEKRVLAKRHFDRAMEEISASISEDMSSLAAIRKFDEKYGDRKGRRKKSAYGFSTQSEAEKNSLDSVRVRNQT
ncbi:MAG: hypothetical protein LQ347_003360 [Umbilicaria vellea]|nr:MAG: hypothetical protein LQ347_003360 [Umbilicaria vellea]